MSNPMVRIISGDTIVDREMNATELAQYELDKISAKAIADARIAKASARQVILDKLGLTADEAQALLG